MPYPFGTRSVVFFSFPFHLRCEHSEHTLSALLEQTRTMFSAANSAVNKNPLLDGHGFGADGNPGRQT